jgi:hypothetical protein
MLRRKALSPPSPPWLWPWLIGHAVLLGQRPLADPEFWWHLARGRAVMAGAMAPSSALLALDRQFEADWLGGWPFYLLETQVGPLGLACVPLLAALGFMAWLAAITPRTATLWLAGVAPVALWLVRDDLGPTPALFDLIGQLTLTGQLAGSTSPRPSAWRIALIFCVWANLSPGVIWGLLLVAAWSSATPWRWLGAALVGGSLTPRGLLSWRDAVVQFAPQAFAGPGRDHPAAWNGLFAGGLDGVELAILLIGIGWAIVRWREPRDGSTAGRVAVPLLSVVLCREHLPMAGLWIAIDLLRSPPAGLVSLNIHRRWSIAIGCGLVAIAVGDATNLLETSRNRLGWGIAQELDPRLLDAATLTVDDAHRGAWAGDARSVGLLCWAAPQIRMVDHPRRALVGGRWPQHAQLQRDLRGAHRAAYRRDDGQWVGLVRQLRDWQVSLLCLPVEDVSLNRAMMETPWRPIDLDSPTVLYVSTDDTYFAPLVLEVEKQERFVEAGPWQPSRDAYDSRGWRVDAIKMLGGRPDPTPAIRQAELFRARRLPMAALRALLPLRAVSSSAGLRDEFRRCHEAFAELEWTNSGATSRFRQLLLRDLHATNNAVPWLAESTTAEPEELGVWVECLSHYRAGRLSAALAAAPPSSDDGRYAAALLALELGDIDRAAGELASVRPSKQLSLAIAADEWLEELRHFGHRSRP